MGIYFDNICFDLLFISTILNSEKKKNDLKYLKKNWIDSTIIVTIFVIKHIFGASNIAIKLKERAK